MKKVFFVIVIALLSATRAFSQLSGTVVDGATGESLMGAVAQFGRRATVTNAYGYFSIASATGADTLRVSFLGYKTAVLHIDTSQKTALKVPLEPATQTIGEVTAMAKSLYRSEIERPQMSHHKVSQADIKSIATIMGEPDALKSLQLMPGVNNVADGSANLSVRGGSHDQNLVILDEAPVYNPTHAMGFISAFSADAISSVDLYKGALPVRYGGRLTSVMDVRMKEGNMSEKRVCGSLGILTSRIMVEGPLSTDKSSFMLSGRFGYGWLFNKCIDIADKLYNHDNKLLFDDIAMKINKRVGDRDRVFLSAYMSQDAFRYDVVDAAADIKWSNRTLTGRWNHVFSPTIFANTTITASQYGYKHNYSSGGLMYDWRARMGEVDAKIDFQQSTELAELTYGFSTEFHHYRPGKMKPLDKVSSGESRDLGSKNMTNQALYFGVEKNFGGLLNFSGGLRMSLTTELGPVESINYADKMRETPLDTVLYKKLRPVKSYFLAEPRLAASLTLSENLSLKASYSRTAQSQHLLTNSALSMPTDIWIPADKYAKPQSANSFAVGVHSFIPSLELELSMEAYFRKTKDLVDFKDGAILRMNEHYEQELLSGKGKAKGIELMIRKDAKNYSITTSYTLSEAKRQVDGINKGRWYYDMYDQRHNLSVAAMVKPWRWLSLSTTFGCHSGGRRTLPIGRYEVYGIVVPVYSERNGFKLPTFHRLDFSARFDLRSHGRFNHFLDLTVYNVYNKKNPISVYTDPLSGIYSEKYKMIYVYRVVPTLTYTFNF
ncbi:MAG: TonB-dependent receptor [Bacteroidales bacterium]|nr:TonB-dependent receptor [Bacteroidales bacterium]